MLKVGLTGGIGSGKSTVSKVFEILGVPVYYADDKAKSLINSNEILKQHLVDAFGPETFTSRGYNTKYIAAMVFSNKQLLHKLNSIVHPFVALDFNEWSSGYSHLHYTIQETAVLFESSAFQLMDFTVVVDAPESLRIQRIIQRDGLTESEIRQRMNNQWPAGKIISFADWVIENDDKNLILPQIIKLHNHLLNLK